MRNLFYLIKSIPFIQTAFNYYFDIKNTLIPQHN